MSYNEAMRQLGKIADAAGAAAEALAAAEPVTLTEELDFIITMARAIRAATVEE